MVPLTLILSVTPLIQAVLIYDSYNQGENGEMVLVVRKIAAIQSAFQRKLCLLCSIQMQKINPV